MVEDSEIAKISLSSALAEFGDAVVVGCADDEKAAVLWLRSNPLACDLVIIDIFIKQGSGLGILAASASTVAPKIVVTNYATEEMRRRCMDLGAVATFDKSNEAEALMQFCRQLVSDTTRH